LGLEEALKIKVGADVEGCTNEEGDELMIED
jgi:hypothetical protein